MDAKSLLAQLPKGNPDKVTEYDIWIESDCGRTDIATIRGIKEGTTIIDLGKWQGHPCKYGCLQVCIRHVGSIDINRGRALLLCDPNSLDGLIASILSTDPRIMPGDLMILRGDWSRKPKGI